MSLIYQNYHDLFAAQVQISAGSDLTVVNERAGRVALNFRKFKGALKYFI